MREWIILFSLLMSCVNPSEKPSPTLLSSTELPVVKEKIPEVDSSKLPIWSAKELPAPEVNRQAHLMATSSEGKLVFAYTDGWRVGEGEVRPLDTTPILLSWSASGENVGMVMKEYQSYKLRVYDVKTGAVDTMAFELPEPDRRGNYPNPTPRSLVHFPEHGGWAVSGTLGIFIVSSKGAVETAEPWEYRDLSGSRRAYAQNRKIHFEDNDFIAVDCQITDLSWSSHFNRVAIQCVKSGGNSLQLIEASTGKILRSLELGIGVSGVGLLNENTVVGLERGAFFRSDSQGIQRQSTDPEAKPGCSAWLAASELIEPLGVSAENNLNMWVIGHEIGGRFGSNPWKQIRVDMKTCAIESVDVSGKLTLNSTPIWLEGMRAFVAEISSDTRYGPALVPVDRPNSWKYIFEQNLDPNDYALSPDGSLLGVGTFDMIQLFGVDESGLKPKATLPPAGKLALCSDTISRLVHSKRQWIVHRPDGEAVGVVNSKAPRIGCPEPQ